MDNRSHAAWSRARDRALTRYSLLLASRKYPECRDDEIENDADIIELDAAWWGFVDDIPTPTPDWFRWAKEVMRDQRGQDERRERLRHLLRPPEEPDTRRVD